MRCLLANLKELVAAEAAAKAGKKSKKKGGKKGGKGKKAGGKKEKGTGGAKGKKKKDPTVSAIWPDVILPSERKGCVCWHDCCLHMHELH